MPAHPANRQAAATTTYHRRPPPPNRMATGIIRMVGLSVFLGSKQAHSGSFAG
ncbi:MAG: hypothetical protein Q7T00_07235 [Rugosibacter sp.]|nr:hypothetical protein [Rugosibacter sp.]MDO9272311.1 hypothetical protein [Rugosibacter sp.]